MTAEVSRTEFDAYRKQHHESMNVVTRALGENAQKLDAVLLALRGDESGKMGISQRVGILEGLVARLESRGWTRWWIDLLGKTAHTVIVGLLVSILVLAAKGFILDTVKDLSSVHVPKGSMIPVERDPSTRLAFTQEPNP